MENEGYPKTMTIYTGIKGMYMFENRMTEMCSMMNSDRNRFIKLYNKAKNKKLLNTFIKPFINRNPKNKFKLSKKRRPLIEVFLTNSDKVAPVITRLSGKDYSGNILLRMLDKGQPKEDDKPMYDWSLNLKPEGKSLINFPGVSGTALDIEIKKEYFGDIKDIKDDRDGIAN